MRSTDVLRNQAIELASRAFGNLGTRFKVFPQAGVPRDPFEKIDVLGGDGIRVSGVNPDGVVRGSGIFAGGWAAQRTAVYGVPEEELGAYYAQHTLRQHASRPLPVCTSCQRIGARSRTAAERSSRSGGPGWTMSILGNDEDSTRSAHAPADNRWVWGISTTLWWSPWPRLERMRKRSVRRFLDWRRQRPRLVGHR
jgi:hypothetical protein